MYHDPSMILARGKRGESMESNILITIKKLLGGEVESDHFNLDIIIQINMALARAFQLGVFDQPIAIDESTEWEEFGLREDVLSMLKTFVYLKTKRVFDTPETASMVQVLDEAIKEQEWLLEVFSRQE